MKVHVVLPIRINLRRIKTSFIEHDYNDVPWRDSERGKWGVNMCNSLEIAWCCWKLSICTVNFSCVVGIWTDSLFLSGWNKSRESSKVSEYTDLILILKLGTENEAFCQDSAWCIQSGVCCVDGRLFYQYKIRRILTFVFSKKANFVMKSTPKACFV